MKLAYLGLGISLALSVTQSLNWSVRMASELESQMVAMERITEFSRMKCELDSTITVADNNSIIGINPLIHQHNLDMTLDVDTNSSWPSMGSIEFINLSMRYRDGLPLVLKRINLRIGGGEKVGIVGRTGSGKTSLLSALLRLVEANYIYGTITIDDVDTATIDLEVLRSRLSIIAQDPTLFSGSLRSNLDPDEEFLDSECCKVLKVCQLPEELQNLNFSVEENGSNVSLGQRQLISIARTILQKSKIVIIDEATSFIDNETDEQIQRVINEEFQMSTVITIAHRLNTIMKSERILVLDDGEVIEFDSPTTLLQQTDSYFAALVKTWGETRE
jgi:ATP-binding cassette subfamily C (CFTR/MRP) protein 1